MTFLLAALLGNFLAWTVHGAMWWLREKCLPLVGWLGCLVGAFSLLALFVLWSFSRPRHPDLAESFTQEDAASDRILMQIAVMWLVLPAIGFCQREWLKIESHLRDLQHNPRLFDQEVERVRHAKFCRAFGCTGAAFSEAAVAIVLGVWVSNFLQKGDVFLIAGAVTLFVLAVARPQTTKVSRWLCQQIAPRSLHAGD